MRVRRLIAAPKRPVSDTNWRTDDIPPRYCPIYARTRPNRAGWQWRSLRAQGNGRRYTLVAFVNLRRANWKSVLILEADGHASVVGRFEYHPSHPGLHLHAHCERGGIEPGPGGLDGLARIPSLGAPHRATGSLTVSTFWEEARRFFRVRDDLGPLFGDD